MPLRPTSLRQRTTLYILIPTFLFLLIVEVMSFRNIRETLVDQLEKSATSHLQRTATYIDTRLRLPKSLLYRLQTAPSSEIRQYILEVLTSLDGIIEVTSPPRKLPENSVSATGRVEADDWEISYSPLDGRHTVTLTATPGSSQPALPGAKALISFYDLIGHIPSAPWWTGLDSFLIDASGNILTPHFEKKASQAKSSAAKPHFSKNVQKRLLSAMQNGKTGIVTSGERSLPDTIYGFYKLTEAPWTLVVRSQGETVLQPLISFRRSSMLFSALTTVLILYLLNLLTTRTINTVKSVSAAATRLAEGHFDQPISAASNDELGELVRCFNAMSSQLQQGVQLKKAMAIAGEVQRNLLPQSQFTSEQISVFGINVPCDETGGDFFDIVNTEKSVPELTVVVGDVVGHGIGAALLMATTRALLRSRISPTGGLSECVSAVNALLCRDTEVSGSFVTIFLLAIDKVNRTLRWVRAGHEPAMLYNLGKDKFSDLRGKGVALGVDSGQHYQENRLELPETPHLIIIGTDGTTDVENDRGEHFGKERLKSFIRRHHSQSPENILQALCLELKAFRGKRRQNDDITLVIVKTT